MVSNLSSRIDPSWVCEKLLESYRNGITAGQNGTTYAATQLRTGSVGGGTVTVIFC